MPLLFAVLDSMVPVKTAHLRCNNSTAFSCSEDVDADGPHSRVIISPGATMRGNYRLYANISQFYERPEVQMHMVLYGTHGYYEEQLSRHDNPHKTLEDLGSPSAGITIASPAHGTFKVKHGKNGKPPMPNRGAVLVFTGDLSSYHQYLVTCHVIVDNSTTAPLDPSDRTPRALVDPETAAKGVRFLLVYTPMEHAGVEAIIRLVLSALSLYLLQRFVLAVKEYVDQPRHMCDEQPWVAAMLGLLAIGENDPLYVLRIVFNVGWGLELMHAYISPLFQGALALFQLLVFAGIHQQGKKDSTEAFKLWRWKALLVAVMFSQRWASLLMPAARRHAGAYVRPRPR